MVRPPVKVSSTNDPAVFVDLVYRDGWLSFDLCNGGTQAVRDVSITFDRKLTGLGGQIDIASLPIWKGLHFMPAGKTIAVPIDRLADTLARDKAKPLELTVSYTDSEDTRWQATITHDLNAYRGMIECLE